MNTDNKMMKIVGGELRDNPGWYKLDGRVEGESEPWSAIRKPDGSWWWVAATHFRRVKWQDFQKHGYKLVFP